MRGIMSELDEDGDGDVTESEWVNFGKQLEDFVLDVGDEEDGEAEQLSFFEHIRPKWNNIDWNKVYYECKENVRYF